MISERQYRLSKKLLWFSRVMLFLAAVMLIWICADYIKGIDTMSNLVAVIIDVALFSSLAYHHKRQIKSYEEKTNSSR